MVWKKIYESGDYYISSDNTLTFFGVPAIRFILIRSGEILLTERIKIPAPGQMSQFNVKVNKVLRHFKDVIESYQAQESPRQQMAMSSVDDAVHRLFGGPGGG